VQSLIAQWATDPIALKMPLIGADAVRTWIHVAYEGEWRGYGSGETIRFDGDFFRQLKASFDDQKNPAPLTWEHPDRRGRTPAAGWILELDVREGDRAELWALTELTDQAARDIRDGAYRFCSIEYAPVSIHRVTGEEVGPEFIAVGLTNQPFLDGQTPIRLSVRGSCMDADSVVAELSRRGQRIKLADGQSTKDMVMEAFAELGDDASVDQVMQYLEAKKALEAVRDGSGDKGDVAMSDTAGEAPEAPPGENDRLPELLAALGVATVDEALALVAEMMGTVETARSDDEVGMSKTLRDQVIALSNRIEQLENERERLELDKLTSDVESVVDRLPQVHGDRAATVRHYVTLARQWPEGWRAQRDAAESRGPQPPRRQLGRAPATSGGAVEGADKDHPLYRSLSKAYSFVSDDDKRHRMILSAMSAAEGGR